MFSVFCPLKTIIRHPAMLISDMRLYCFVQVMEILCENIHHLSICINLYVFCKLWKDPHVHRASSDKIQTHTFHIIRYDLLK